MRRLLRIAGWSVLGLVLATGLVGLAVWRELTMDLPTVTELLDYRPPAATRVLAADGPRRVLMSSGALI
jgi:membrane carboxypeptidase/penicillin-binding protein